MSLSLGGVRGLITRYNDERGSMLMRLFDSNLDNIDKIANIVRYGVNKAREVASRVTNPKYLNEMMKGYGKGLLNEIDILERNLLHDYDIASYLKVKEARYLGKLRDSLGIVKKYLYRGNIERGYYLLHGVVARLNSMRGPAPDYEQMMKTEKKGPKHGIGVSQAAMMMALIGFFSLFLYTMAPSSTGQTIAFSSFNIYIIGIFTFVTALALYLIYKM